MPVVPRIAIGVVFLFVLRLIALGRDGGCGPENWQNDNANTATVLTKILAIYRTRNLICFVWIRRKQSSFT